MVIQQTGSNMIQVYRYPCIILVSYSTPVAYYDRKTHKLHKTSRFWSSTTSRHISKFAAEIDKLYHVDGAMEAVPQDQISVLLDD